MAAYDIERIRASLSPLSSYLLADGHELRRAGRKLFTCCPFHHEKSGSCSIDDERGRFHCFGCGERGDTIDYISKTRGTSLADTLAMLAQEKGITTLDTYQAPRPRPTFEEKPALPFTHIQSLAWRDSCQRLLFDEYEIQRIAEWRGIDPACLRYLAEKELIGLHPYYSIMREAFLVQRPENGSLIPLAAHCRLSPGTKGNEDIRGKASWRYDPPGCGAWPFVVGDIATAKYLFINEGQWDSIALISMMQWHVTWPSHTALIGLRGSTSAAKFLLHPIHPKAIAFAFADSDNAGSKWFEPNNFLDQLTARVHRVHAYWPSAAKSDFNDIVKSGLLDRDTFLAYLRAKLPQPKQRTNYPTFRQWLDAHAPPDSPHHHAYATISTASYRPLGRAPIHHWQTLWKKHHDAATLDLLTAAYRSYLATR
ncbi:Zinc finger, CHC2-type [uncultured Caudovirales phage]|uniref:Zinc finger, CHC2-type n=1 Tax=uncultured Caudovirales phage TaxID=2100421 RepID=A0A6J5NGQ8_9CAUD|nr:Zinc finger, CHC2-type [uncultured Caudovirales phage]CAB5224240.1 Zinc finger, CHC2-type [uncultured Caudovirales phage]